MNTRKEYQQVLTRNQFEILEALNAVKPNPISRKALELLLGPHNSNSIDVTIFSLRKALPKIIIKTHRSIGYSLEIGGWTCDKNKCHECGQVLKK